MVDGLLFIPIAVDRARFKPPFEIDLTEFGGSETSGFHAKPVKLTCFRELWAERAATARSIVFRAFMRSCRHIAIRRSRAEP